MILLDENDEIDDLNDDDMADPEFFPQLVNQREATVDSESESDEEDEDNSIADTLSSPPSKKRTEECIGKKEL